MDGMFGTHDLEQQEEKVSQEIIKKFNVAAKDIYDNSVKTLIECERVIIELDHKIMDKNEENEENEGVRKQMRPLTNELLNHIKMTRNVLSFLNSEVNFWVSRNKPLTKRFIERVVNCYSEYSALNKQTVELSREFCDKYSGYFDENSIDKPQLG